MRNFLRSLSTPAVLFYLFLVVTQVATGIYLAREAEPPPAGAALYILLTP